MGQFVDNMIAARVLWLLVQPWQKTDAFKLGIVDKDGKLLIHVDDFTTQEQKDAYSYLHRLCFNLKRLLAKLPGGSTMLASLVAAYFLIKEGIEHDDLSNLEERLNTLTKQINDGLVLVEEQLLVEQFLSLVEDELNEDGAPAVSGGAGIAQGSDGAAAGQTTIAGNSSPIGAVKRRNSWKDLPKTFGVTSFKVSGKAYNGFKGAKIKGKRWDEHMVPSDEDKEVYEQIRQYSKVYPKKPIMISHKDMDIHQFIKH